MKNNEAAERNLLRGSFETVAGLFAVIDGGK